jgi:hypothetical protein
MCKNGALPENENRPGQSAETVNVGLINSSSTSFNEIPIWEIVEIVSLIILFLLVVRWIRKWFNKRKLAKINMRARHMAQVAAHLRPTNLEMDIQQPRLKQLQHRPTASLTEINMESAPTPIINSAALGTYDPY